MIYDYVYIFIQYIYINMFRLDMYFVFNLCRHDQVAASLAKGPRVDLEGLPGEPASFHQEGRRSGGRDSTLKL